MGGGVIAEFLPPDFKVEEGRDWLKRASKPAKRTSAWPGMDVCARPHPTEVRKDSNMAACYYARTPHRHCECGVAIDLDHGFCDECMRALLRGAAMSRHQSEAMRSQREEWLARYGFIEFTIGGIKVKRS